MKSALFFLGALSSATLGVAQTLCDQVGHARTPVLLIRGSPN